jgi:hypothetical protein
MKNEKISRKLGNTSYFTSIINRHFYFLSYYIQSILFDPNGVVRSTVDGLSYKRATPMGSLINLVEKLIMKN